MYQSLLRDSRFFDLLLTLDEDLAAEARRVGCACGGVLHSALRTSGSREGGQPAWRVGARCGSASAARRKGADVG